MKKLVAEMEGKELDYFCAKVVGLNPEGCIFRPSLFWYQGAPLIDKYRINLNGASEEFWEAWIGNPFSPICGYWRDKRLLVAAMRCLVASKFGEKVDAP